MAKLFRIPNIQVAIVDAVQAICRDKRIRMPFGRELDVLTYEDKLTATAEVRCDVSWGPGSSVVLSLSRPSADSAWEAVGAAGFRFGSAYPAPLVLYGAKLEFDILPVRPVQDVRRLWRPMRYSLRNMKYRGRHGESVASQKT